jgi:hypothetical protein
VIALLRLTPAELSGEVATKVRDGLDRTVGQRLGLASRPDAVVDNGNTELISDPLTSPPI